MSKKCGKCLQYFSPKELFPIGKKDYCKLCLPKARAQKEFEEYVCWLFGLKKPGPLIWSQRKTFIEKYGYTDNQMVLTLKYIYEVRKTPRAQASLGLIPSNFEAAKEYYKNLKQESEIFMKDLQNLISNPIPVREIHISDTQSNGRQGGKGKIDLNTLFEE